MKMFCVDEIDKKIVTWVAFIQDIGYNMGILSRLACHKDWADKVNKLIKEVKPI